jgi:hypothetical protein
MSKSKAESYHDATCPLMAFVHNREFAPGHDSTNSEKLAVTPLNWLSGISRLWCMVTKMRNRMLIAPFTINQTLSYIWRRHSPTSCYTQYWHGMKLHWRAILHVPVTYLEYFGTYLGYLSTNHMSQHSDTFPANPTLNPRHSTSLLTAELVLFLLRNS